MGEFNYDNVELDFSCWNLTWGSISLLENQFFLIFPAFKTKPFCQRVTLTVSAATDDACTIKSLCNLFKQFSKAYYQPLFTTCTGTFSCNYIIRQL